MSSKINIWDIIQDHFATLRNEQTGKTSLIDVFTFFGIGALAACVSYFLCFDLSDGAIGLMVTAFSIFAGLLINVLVLIYTVSQRDSDLTAGGDAARRDLERRFLRQIFANLSFAILIAVFCVVLLSIISFIPDTFRTLLSSVALMAVIDFLMTLLMSLKRLYILLTHRFSH